MTTNEGIPFVVWASKGSLTMTPSGGKISLLREWLMRYVWSSVANGPWMRSTLQGKLAFVTLKGVSHICGEAQLVVPRITGQTRAP